MDNWLSSSILFRHQHTGTVPRLRLIAVDGEILVNLRGITWSVNGQSITGGNTGNIDFSVTVGTNTIPVDVINNVTGERKSQQISESIKR